MLGRKSSCDNGAILFSSSPCNKFVVFNDYYSISNTICVVGKVWIILDDGEILFERKEKCKHV